ncbi:transglutaminase-like domain-containing protein, partial [Falsiroseomonas selenitidurans]
GRLVAVTLRRRFPAEALPPGRPARLRLPAPLPGPGVSDLVVEVLEQPSGAPPATLSPGRMEVRLEAPADAVLALRATARIAPLLRGALPPEPLPAEAAALHLRREEGFIRVTPAIAALAAAAGEGPPLRVAQAIWRATLARLQVEPIHYAEVDVAAPGEWVLARGAADCQLVSALLVALFRARGIPARLVGGVLPYPRAPSRHYWAEAHLGGAWHPFDAIARDLDDNGRVPAWHDAFAGQLEPRLVTERHPRLFTGAPGVPMPPAWLMLRRLTRDGAAVRHVEAGTGRLLYEEEIAVTLGDLSPG